MTGTRTKYTENEIEMSLARIEQGIHSIYSTNCALTILKAMLPIFNSMRKHFMFYENAKRQKKKRR
jgi:hypothetical protein